MNRAPQVRLNRPCFFNARLLCKPRSKSGRFLCPLQGRVFGEFLTALTQYFLTNPYKSQSMMPGGGGEPGLLPGQMKIVDIGKCMALEHEDLVREFWLTGRIPNRATCEALSASVGRFKDIRFAHRYGME